MSVPFRRYAEHGEHYAPRSGGAHSTGSFNDRNRLRLYFVQDVEQIASVTGQSVDSDNHQWYHPKRAL